MHDVSSLAEGVETEKQHRLLKQFRCDYGQGYFYSRPIDVESFEKNICVVREIPDEACAAMKKNARHEIFIRAFFMQVSSGFGRFFHGTGFMQALMP